MKLYSIIALVFAFSFFPLVASESIQKNISYRKGEKLVYRMYYNSLMTGNVTAGEAIIEVKKTSNIDSTYHIKAVGETRGAFRWFYDVHDEFESFVHMKKLRPVRFKKDIQEGKYTTSNDVHFNHVAKEAVWVNKRKNKKGKVSITDNVQDLLSAIYYARNLDLDSVELNDRFRINFFMDDSIYSTQLRYTGIETIKTSIGRIECLKFRPSVLKGQVFKEEAPLTVYVTNDRNRLPVFAESEIKVGRVRMELVEYSGLKNAFKSMKRK